jgi:hypothetical protein
MHLELISVGATAPGSSGAAAAPYGQDSLTIKNSLTAGMILAIWAQQQADGFVQITKPSGHDTTRGWRQVVDAATISNLLAGGFSLDVEPQELLSVLIAGSATGGVVENAFMQVLYEDLPGVNSRMIGWEEAMERTEWSKLLTIQCTLTGAAAGYTGEELITAESDLLMANRDYAVLGMTTNVEVGALYIYGPDTGYQRAAVPGGISEADYGRDWFCSLARAYGMPLIPVINSGNKQSTRIGFVQNENNVSPEVSISLALLDKQ